MTALPERGHGGGFDDRHPALAGVVGEKGGEGLESGMRSGRSVALGTGEGGQHGSADLVGGFVHERE